MFKKGVNPYNKGQKLSKEHKDKISKSNLGKTYSLKVKKRMSDGQKLRFTKMSSWNKGLGKKQYNCFYCRKDFISQIKNRKYCSQSCYIKANSGENNYRSIKDRSKVKLDTERGGTLHKEWSKAVKNRDSWKCKINNSECIGKVIAHHIMSWKDYPEFRYIVSNGITLCKKHHPLKRVEELKNIPIFKSLVNQYL